MVQKETSVMNKMTRNVIILIAVLAVLGGGCFWILNYEPPKEEKAPVPETNSVTVYEVSEDAISKIVIENEENGKTFIRSGDAWIIEGYSKEDLAASKVDSFISSVERITSSDKVTDSLEVCGLNEPKTVVRITKNDGTQDVFKIGDKSPLLGKYFFTLNDGEIYTMSSYIAEGFIEPVSYYTEFTRASFKADEIFDLRIERAGKNTIQLSVKDEADDTMTSWKITEPYSVAKNALDQYISEQILTRIEAINISKPATVKETGLSSPKAVFTFKSAKFDEEGNRTDEKSTTIKVGNTNGDVTYIEYEGKAYEVEADSVSFVNIDPILLVSKLEALTPIAKLHKMTVKKGAEEFVLDVTHSQLGSDDDEMSFKMNGEFIEEDPAKKLYQEVIGLMADGEYKNTPFGELVCEVLFELEGSQKTVKLYKLNDMSASFTVNDSTVFTVKLSAIESMINNMKSIINGEKEQ